MGSKAVQLTEEQLDTLAQNELDRLQKAFRLMETDKEAYSEDVRRIILKQKTVLSHLEREKKELETLLACGDNKFLKKKEEERIRILQLQLKEYDEVEHDIRKEGLELKELESKVEKLQRDVRDFKNKHKIQNVYGDGLKKQVKIDENLESRLNVETIKFNKLISENQLLRQEIDHLLIERGQFNMMFQQVVGKLNSGKKVLMDLIEQSTMAYDKREEALTKLDALRARARQDLVQHSQEMRELKRKLDNETKLHDFVGAKGAKRINVDLEGAIETKKRKEREAKELHIQEYRKILDNIKMYFKESDVERVIASYLKIEEDNFNLFSFINELNKQVGVLREQLCEAREKIEDQREKNTETEKEQMNTLLSLQDELVVCTQEADEAENNLTTCRTIVNQLLEGLNAVFKLIQCDPTPILTLLGSNSVANIHNFELYLNILEKRVIEIGNLIWYLTYSRVAVKAAKLFPGQVSFLREPIMKELVTTLPKKIDTNKYIASQPCPLCTQKDDISEVDETIATPMVKEEVIDLVKEVLFSPEYEDRLHNVSACRLPKSRRIMQRRFQN
ncbi:hypothetical protein RUM44_007570 [Polyplax serrata]|uniref:ODAD1 central coiled coil region domain-containing protein n=1 Tax=Polyplax serrata TaxID=468196 RepID=A0ABR1B6X0_POLSC